MIEWGAVQKGAVLVLSIALVLSAPSFIPGLTPGTQPSDEEFVHSSGNQPADGFDPDVAHAHNLTGHGISVGVIDTTGFDLEYAPLQGQVAEFQSFSEAGIRNDGASEHGTAAAETVLTVAPDANLYLANFDSVDGYRRAVEWGVQNDVDILVIPVGFFGQPDDGSSPPSQILSQAAEQGTIVVVSAGNLAKRHWVGTYGNPQNGYLRYDDNDTENFLQSNTNRFVGWLTWDHTDASGDFDAILYRYVNESYAEPVATSSPYQGSERPTERIVTELPAGRYFVRIRGPPNGTGTRLELTTPTHRLEYRNATSSLSAPATARNVIVAGAYNQSRGVEAFSSWGPTTDGRAGVDIVAPNRHYAHIYRGEFVGTSASSPYVGGVVALLLSADPELSPTDVERILERTASDIGPPGVDTRSGSGRIDPQAALNKVQNGTTDAQ